MSHPGGHLLISIILN